MIPLPITVFFDFTCPFSYVAAATLGRRAAEGEVEVHARALELFPAPAVLRAPADDPAWETTLLVRAESLGIALRVPGFRPRTRKAHEAAIFAAEHCAGAGMRAAIFAAYWREGRDIGRIDVLVSLAPEVGLDPVDLRIALDIDRHLDAVLRDEALAERLRVVSTPTLFVGSGHEARVLVGAPVPEELEAAIAAYGSLSSGEDGGAEEAGGEPKPIT